MKKKVFISGPMRGLPNNNDEAFMKAEKYLKSLGYSVFNPAWMRFDESWSRNDIWLLDIAALNACDAIYQLPGWENSSGAMMEYTYAKDTEKEFIPYID